MESKFVEVTNGDRNWGKFLLLRFTSAEFTYPSAVPGYPTPLLRSRGWNPKTVWVLDLETKEGAAFVPYGSAAIDLNEKHRIWVCPMFEPFLVWLYSYARQNPDHWFAQLPPHVDLPDAPEAWAGYRRTGKG